MTTMIQRKRPRKLYAVNRLRFVRRKDRVKVMYRRLARRLARGLRAGKLGKG